ncbi:non-ribosomal peptide synthetase [Catellatospora citrea]|uniref:Carrier domain-containing protein n=1 Tax=Catellatospora citrea TaxID=53366 RepID=A0A8J3KBF3_9ACTN|nr:non-ribosomal peptide synthetase [Catellatospora citrea]RKE05523.1 amino acid adenylation domain-containing protein [Catellatospora citrea]GIF96871.1 hypothetical protein Cci01nite_19650 [Catellatospora citrea]
MTPLPSTSWDQRLDQIVRGWAHRRPDATAVVSTELTVTYRQLDDLADRYAADLIERSVRPGDVVPLAVPQSVTLIALMLAVAKVGAAYAVVDPDWPDDRLRGVLRNMRSPIVVAGAEVRLPDDRPRWTPPDAAQRIGTPPPRELPEPPTGPADPCCVLFTSGTTAEAKCMVTPHRAVARLFVPEATVTFGPGSVVPQLAPLQWDGSVLEIWSALLTGATLVLVADPLLTPADLRRMIQRDGVTTMWLTSSLFNTLVDVDLAAFTGLRQVMTGGERLSVPHVRGFLTAHPDIVLINGYGPAENTVFTTTHRIRPQDCAVAGGIPTGRAVPHTEVFVLDDARPVPPGQPGEVCVAGAGLADGYLGDPVATARSFVEVDIDGRRQRVYRTGDRGLIDDTGVLHYLGRMDRQLKVRGRRVEPVAVEHVLAQVAAVAQVAVVPRRDRAGNCLGLVAFYTTGDGRPATAQIRAAAARQLADYELPDAFVHRATMPLTANGKTDLRALQEQCADAIQPSQHRARAGDMPEGTLATVVEVFAAALDIEPDAVDVDSSLRALGGSSVSAIRASALLQQRGWAVPAVQVLGAGSARELARWLDEHAPSTDLDAAAGTGRFVPLTGMQQGFLMEHLADPTNLSGHCLLAWQVNGPLDVAALDQAIDDVVSRHGSLRAAYRLDPEPGAHTGPATCPAPRLQQLVMTGPPDLDAAVTALRTALSRPFDLECGVVLHARHMRLDDMRALVGVAVAHIAFDGWSESVFARELSQAYSARRTGAAPRFDTPPPSLPELSTGRPSGKAATRHRQYWANQLRAIPALPLARGSTPGLHHHEFRLDEADVAQLRHTAAKYDTTLFTALVASYGRALGAATGATDFGVGVPVAQRTGDLVDRAIGCLINMICLRIRPTTWDAEYAAELADTIMHAMQADVPFAEVVQILKPPRSSRPPLYQTLFTYQDTVPAHLDLAGTTTTALAVAHLGIPTELLVEVWPDHGGLRYVFTAQADAVSQDQFLQIVAAQRDDLGSLGCTLS